MKTGSYTKYCFLSLVPQDYTQAENSHQLANEKKKIKKDVLDNNVGKRQEIYIFPPFVNEEPAETLLHKYNYLHMKRTFS